MQYPACDAAENGGARVREPHAGVGGGIRLYVYLPPARTRTSPFRATPHLLCVAVASGPRLFSEP